MANVKLWVAAGDGRARTKPADASRKGPNCSAAAPGALHPAEGLRLIRALSRISDPARRAGLIEQTEQYHASDV